MVLDEPYQLIHFPKAAGAVGSHVRDLSVPFA